jgi:predicted amidohydrolase YtcJ
VRKKAFKEVLHERFVRQGVTSIYDFPSPDGIRISQELLNTNELPLRLRYQIIIDRTADDDAIMKTGLMTGFGNDWLRIGGIKIFVDGAGKTAVRYDPPGQKEKYAGILKVTQEELNEMVLEAHEAGFQLWIHAIGDKAQDMTLDALELALQKVPREDHRHRIEHAGNAAGPNTPGQLDRMKRLGVIPVPTAAWIYLGSGQRTPMTKRFIYRTLLDQGFRPPGNSDSLGSMPESMNPLFSIWAAVARKTRAGELNCPEESITVMEAIRMYTMDSAYSGFEEKVKGSIEKGKYADVIVLSEDPLTVPVDRIKDIQVETTIIDGKIVYQKQT